MGLLDDAIREHLELKRLRGADPGEVARLEREALGPVRRGAAGPEEFADDETFAPPPFDAEHAADRPLVDEPQTLIPGGEPSPVGQETAEIDMQTVIGAEPGEPPAAPEVPRPAPPAYEDEEYAPREEYAPGVEVAPEEPAEPAEEYSPYEEVGEHEYAHREHPGAGAPSPAPADEVATRVPEPEPPAEEPVEDVLEETPSFLQQTPEHDRLWFEQQPPRDFDFDK